jgi:hypothetical protein
MGQSVTARHLHEVDTALDPRRPQPRRAGEAAVMRDSAELRTRAVERIARLERDPIAA